MTPRRGLGFRSVRTDEFRFGSTSTKLEVHVQPLTADRVRDLAARYSCRHAEVIDRAVEALWDAAREPLATRQVVLIGEAPPVRLVDQPERWLLPDPARRGEAGWRMLQATGLPLDDYLALFERTNLLEHAVRGNEWPIDEAKTAASVLRRALPGRTAVLLGRRVQQAFGVGDAPDLAWRDVASYGGRPLRVLCCPHPSGLCHFWNSPHNCERAREVFAELAGAVLRRRSQ